MPQVLSQSGKYPRTQIYQPKPLGVVLREADLVSAAQIEMALKYQGDYPCLRLGEILSIQGWIDSGTTDFFARKWSRLVALDYRKPLGYYLKQAKLLEQQEIEAILSEQMMSPYRFGAIAVTKGHLKPATLDFFVKYLFPEELGESGLRSQESLIRSRQRQRELLSEIIKRNSSLIFHGLG